MSSCHIKLSMQKNNVDCNILKNYIQNRELILSSFGENRKIIKELFLSILNGGFENIYSDDKQTNNYLKLFEQEIIRIQNYFYSHDKRYLDIDYNYKGNKGWSHVAPFSRLYLVKL